MLKVVNIDIIMVIISTILIFICFIGLLISIRFQIKKKNKYKDCLQIIDEREKNKNINDMINCRVEINTDNKIDENQLMMDLYDMFLKYIDNLNENNDDFDNILTGFIKDVYKERINIYKEKKYKEKMDDIELIGYSIIEYDKDSLKFRVALTCFNYKVKNEAIVSGSNLERVEQIYIISYLKTKKKWLINNIEKLIEKKLSIQ